jgi:hypothetical protein
MGSQRKVNPTFIKKAALMTAFFMEPLFLDKIIDLMQNK